jgi:tetratricopeptide (TPR) repeat protein
VVLWRLLNLRLLVRPEVFSWQVIARRTAFCVGLFVGFNGIAASQATPPNSVYEKAIQDFQNGRAADAENTLRSVLRSHPQDLQALSLIAVILDSERRYSEAGEFYIRALKIAPRSAAILNNLGDHYLAVNDLKKAQESFHAVLAVDSHHANANLQMAQMSVQAGHGVTALGYLTHLKDADQAEPIAGLLMAQAYALTGKCDSASKKLDELEGKTALDATFRFSMGLAYATCKQYGPAENSFSEALKSDPNDFDILYNLALAASRNGDMQRAQQAFAAALSIKPDDPDTLSACGKLLIEEKDFMGAAAMLNHAAHVAPERSDVLLPLAHATEELEFFGEAAGIYERYLKFHPEDDVAHREHGFDLVRAIRTHEGLPEIEQYVSKHPTNIEALYELAIGEITDEPEKALHILDKTLSLDPGFMPARYTRAALNFQVGKLSESLDDLQRFLKQDSENPNALDLMGQIYLKQDCAQDAGQVLKKAAGLAPHNRTILWHYSEVLRKLRRTDELNAVMAELRKISEGDDGSRHAWTGLLDFLDLPPTQQDARYLASMRAAVAKNPRDVLLKTRLAKILLQRGDTDEAVTIFDSILAGGADNDTLADCGRTLVQHEQYQLAMEFLKKVPNPGLDPIIALLHTAGAEAASEKLDNVPDVQRDGDYYLLRAQVLDSAGKSGEATDSLNRSIRSSPPRADIYFRAAQFLVKHDHRKQAADVLAEAIRLFPDTAEIWMARALVLALDKRCDEALKVLAQIESRWPEWNLAYLVNGILLESQLKPAESKSMLDMAISLGARQADAFYYQALAITEINPEDLAEARKAIAQAIALNPNNAAIHALAGQISLDGKDYKGAAEELQMAVSLQPTLVSAHHLLRTAYLGLGDKDKAVGEASQIEAITQKNSDSDQLSSSMERLLFSVRAPEDNVASQ